VAAASISPRPVVAEIAPRRACIDCHLEPPVCWGPSIEIPRHSQLTAPAMSTVMTQFLGRLAWIDAER
jgi:hypothetical protein